jgi:WD40 repeat protein
MKLRYLILATVMTWSFTAVNAQNDPNAPTLQQIYNELQTIRSALEQQNDKVNRLWRVAQPYLAELETRIDQEEKQQKEDAALKMQEISKHSDVLFTGKLMFVPRSHTLMLAHKDNTIRFVDVNTAVDINSPVRLDSVANCLTATTDGATLFAGTEKGSVYTWKFGAETPTKIIDSNSWPIDSLAISPDGNLITWATNGKYGSNKQWLEPNESCCVYSLKDNRKLFGCDAGRADFQAVSFSPDSRILALIKNSKVDLLDAATGAMIRELYTDAYSCGPLSVVCSPTDNLIAIGYAPYHIGLWNAETGTMTRLLEGHTNWVVSLCFTKDGKRLISSAGDLSASVWNIQTGEEIGRFRFSEGYTYLYSVSVSSDGKYIAIGRMEEWIVCQTPKIP